MAFRFFMGAPSRPPPPLPPQIFSLENTENFQVSSERLGGDPTQYNYHSITFMPQHHRFSFEELPWASGKITNRTLHHERQWSGPRERASRCDLFQYIHWLSLQLQNFEERQCTLRLNHCDLPRRERSSGRLRRPRESNSPEVRVCALSPQQRLEGSTRAHYLPS